MKEDKKNVSLQQMDSVEVEAILREAEATIAEIQESIEMVKSLQRALETSDNDIEAIMPEKLYSSEEREKFVEGLSSAAEEVETLAGKKGAKEAPSTSKKSVPRRKRGFSV